MSKSESKKKGEAQKPLCRHGFHSWKESERKDAQGNIVKVMRCEYCGKVKEE